MNKADALRNDFTDDLCRTVASIQNYPRIVAEPAAVRASKAIDWESVLPALDAALDDASGRAFRRARAALEIHAARTSSSPLLGSISVFRALGFRRDEVAHTQAMAWLLDPTKEHGFGHAVFFALGRAIVCDEPELEATRREIFGIEAGRLRVVSEHRLNRACRADVLIEGCIGTNNSWSLVIEAKIDASESKNQLSGLLAAAPGSRRLGVFLSPDGRAGTTHDGGWARLSYASWARELILLQPLLDATLGAPFLRMYLTGVLEDVCKMKCSGDLDSVVARNSPFQLVQLLEERA